MKRIGNLKEVLGTSANDRIKVGHRQIAYGSAGNDRLTAVTDPLLGIQSASLLVGGIGEDTYIASRKGLTVLLDAGESNGSNTVVAKGIGLSRQTSFVMDVDNRHLLAGDTSSGQIVIALDWKKPGNRFRSLELADGRYSGSEIERRYKGFSNYLGNYSWKGLEDGQFLDFKQVGLSASSINGAIQAVINRAGQL